MQKKLPVGLQVYSVRHMIESGEYSFASLMEQIKKIGYDGVELAGLYDLSPEAVRDAVKNAGLVAVSAHVPLVDMIADAEKVAHDYEIIGTKYIAVPYLPEEYRHLTPGYETVIAEMTRIAKVLGQHGITLLYHNHDFEFVTLPDGTFGLDDIYRRIPAELLQTELDTCWVKVAGQSPDGYVRKYAGRAPIVHLKDFFKEGNPKNMYELIGIETEKAAEDTGKFEFRPVGLGMQDWQPILDASVEAGAEWVVVEQDESIGRSQLEAVEISRKYLQLLGW